MERFVCIHGHFYQPPRENPWLEAIEIQDSAYPYHDWNERVTAECYAPNAAARRLDGEGRITGIISNYARISFNFGPTLLSWMERCAPDVYRAILEADRQSIPWRSGHGAALAQVYNHLIMPLASLSDKRTQVRWGISDFLHRFRRPPEGLWLPETAVDTESLEVLAEAGIRFTILAPHQAARVRRIGGERWKDVSGARIDPSRPYRCRLPSGRSIALFFYDGPISQAVAFEKLLDSGERFAARLMSAFSPHRPHAQLAHIATDGETYGHHHTFGEMALGHALDHLENNGLARLTTYGEFLELHPPTHEVAIVENSSWSCMHGIERWRGNCGCNSGNNRAWNQEWRRPLRKTLDWLGGRLASCYERAASRYLRDPWQARDDYIRVVLDRSPGNVDAFLERHCPVPREEGAEREILRLLEMQRHAMLMFTSCGWFFDEPSGLETVQILRYAGRAIQLAESWCGRSVRASFLKRLARVVGNLPELGNGSDLFARFVAPAELDLIRVGAHYAVSSIFEEYGDQSELFCYRVRREDFLLVPAGRMRLALGRVAIRSTVTRDAEQVSFCTLYFGDHALNCGVRSFLGEDAYQSMKREVLAAFSVPDVAAIIRLMDAHFGMHTYSLKDLFRDEQRAILKLVIAGTLKEFEESFSSLFLSGRSLMTFLRETGMPVPRRFMLTAQTALNLELRRALAAEVIDGERIRAIVRELEEWRVEVDQVELELLVRRRLEETMRAVRDQPRNGRLMNALLRLLECCDGVPLRLNLWHVQNLFVEMLRSGFLLPGPGDEGRDGRDGQVRELGRLLHFNVPALLASRGGEG